MSLGSLGATEFGTAQYLLCRAQVHAGMHEYMGFLEKTFEDFCYALW